MTEKYHKCTESSAIPLREVYAVNAIRLVAAACDESVLVFSYNGQVVPISCASLLKIERLTDVERLIREAAE